MNLSGMFNKVSGTFEEFHKVLDKWHVPRSQNGKGLGLQHRAMMLLAAIEDISPGLNALLQLYFETETRRGK